MRRHIMSINLISTGASIDYSTFRNGVRTKELVAPFYADIAGLEGADWDNYTTMTQEALNATSTKLTITNSTYAVDSNGFFGTDFNKAAGIPDNIKIHQAMYAQADAYAQQQGGNVTAMDVISRVWTLFKTISGDTLDPNNDGYISQQEINAMPKSYVSKGSLMDGIVSIQHTTEEKNTLVRTAANIGAASDGALDCGYRGFMDMGVYSRIDTDPEIALFAHREIFEDYTGVAYDKDLPSDKIALGELFDSFFCFKVDQETAGSITANSDNAHMGIDVNATREYYKFLESGEDMQTYLAKTKGESYLQQFKTMFSTLPNGIVIPDLADKFFDEIDQQQQELYNQYIANAYAFLDPNTSNSAATQISTDSILSFKSNNISKEQKPSELTAALNVAKSGKRI